MTQVEGRREAPGRSAGDDAPSPARGEDALHEHVPPHVLDDDIDAEIACELFAVRHEVSRLVVHDMVGAQRARALTLGVAPCRGDYAGPEELRDLNRRGRYPAARGLNERRLARAYPPFADDHLPCRQEDEGEGGRFNER